MTAPFTTTSAPNLPTSRARASGRVRTIAPLAAALAITLAVALTERPVLAQPASAPCPGCVLRVPPLPHDRAPPDAPRPLLVALHGDGGGLGKLVRAWTAAADAAGVIFFAPRCPIEKGCRTGSFWQWLASPSHDPAWLGDNIDELARRLPINRDRIYATGYSGGATYLGWYVPTNPTRFAAVAHVAGGNTYGVTCPSCKLPVLFVIGGVDPMITPYTRPLYEYYQSCDGHEPLWEQLPGVTHEGMLDVLRAGRGRKILDWLLTHRSACTAIAPDAGVLEDAGIDPEDAGAQAVQTAPDAISSAEAPARPPIAAHPPLPEIPPRASSCACDLAPRSDHPADRAWPLALVTLALLAARRAAR